MKKIRTRYAPSPTGYLHIGGARTALFCYLYAKHFDGDFIFRLEDTDIARNVVGGEESQLKNLEWLGIVPDESPLKPNSKYGKYRQSEKLEHYSKIAQTLLDKGLVYKAYDTVEELEMQNKESKEKGIVSFRYDRNWLKISEEEKQKRDQNKQYSLRFAMPKNYEYKWNDIVRNEISFNSNDIGDWVIFKSDGFPTYNFAVVVDDHDMEITHVLRGEEHIANTPKQLAIYNALGWEAPQYGHLTIITNMEGHKLSKRDTSLKQFIEDYRNEGYHPHAVFNFLALLGWTAEDASEKMTKEELIQKFDPKRLSKSPSKFDIQKMQWFSKQYIKEMDNNLIAQKIKHLENYSDQWIDLFIDTYKQNVYTFNQIQESLKIYSEPKKVNNFKKPLSDEDKKVINSFKEKLENSEFNIQNIQNIIKEIQSELNVKGKKLFMPIRIATTYEEHGPELAKAIYLFGKKLILERLNNAN